MAVSIAFINNSVLHSSGNLLLYSSIDSSTISGDQIYMYTFNVLTGISFETMQRLPINHVLIALSLFTLGRRLAKGSQVPSPISIAFAASVVFLLDTKYDVGDTTFFVKGAGTVLYLMFLLLLLNYSEARSTSALVGLLVLFVANSFFDYTAQAWMIAAVIPFALVNRARRGSAGSVRLSNVLILVVVVFLASRSILYAVYVPWMRQVLIASSIQSFVHGLPFFSDSTAYPFQGSRPSPPSVFVANALTFAATTTVTAYYLLRVIWRRWKKDQFTREDFVVASLFLPMPLTVAIYLPIGLVALSYAILMLPMLSAYCVWSLSRKGRDFSFGGTASPYTRKHSALLPAFLGLLLVLAGLSYIGSLQSGTPLPISNSKMNGGAAWLFERTNGRVTVLSDLDSLGKLLIARSSYLGGSYENLSLRYYDSQSYTSIVRPEYTGADVGGNGTLSPIYVVIDAATSTPVSSVGWQTFEPLSAHRLAIQSNAFLSQVYSDGTCLIEIWQSG